MFWVILSPRAERGEWTLLQGWEQGTLSIGKASGGNLAELFKCCVRLPTEPFSA